MGNRMETSVKSMDDKFKSQISENPVVIYSKSTCGYCKKARYVLDSENINYLNVELDQIEDGKDLYKSVHAVTKSAYVPQIFICKKYIGGYDGLQQLLDSGKLQLKVNECALSRY